MWHQFVEGGVDHRRLYAWIRSDELQMFYGGCHLISGREKVTDATTVKATAASLRQRFLIVDYMDEGSLCGCTGPNEGRSTSYNG